MNNPFEEILQRLSGIESAMSEPRDRPPAMPTEIISREELCKRLDLTEPTIIRWEKKGKIPSFRIGSAVRYNWPVVIESLEKKGVRL
jgi:excisionase family DNA binding protein